MKYLLQVNVEEAFDTVEEMAARVERAAQTELEGHTVTVLGIHAGADYDLPFEEVAGGPVDQQIDEGSIADAIDVAGGVIQSPVLGNLPTLVFGFRTVNGPRRITLVMDAPHLRAVRSLISSAIDKAILHARRMPRAS